MKLDSPLAELVAAVSTNPHFIAPLVATRPAPDRLHFSAEEAEKIDRDEVEEPAYDSKHLPVGIVHLPTVDASLDDVPTDSSPPVSMLEPGEIPPPIEFDEFDFAAPPPAAPPAILEAAAVAAEPAPAPTALARIALRRQVTRPNVVVEEEPQSRRDKRSE